MILAITDRNLMGPDPLARIRSLLERRGTEVIVQIREKDLDGRALFEWVRSLLPAAKACGSGLYVNGRADVVRCFAPDVGLHLPEDGLPIEAARLFLPAGTPIGASAHDVGGVRAKLAAGAALVTIAPIFATPKKPGASVLGIDGLLAIMRALPAEARVRVFALGGIDATNREAVLKTGVGGIAAIRSAWI